MGINLSAVPWDFVGLMTAMAFITALLGSFIAYRNRALGAVIAAILFGIGFVVWNYYPHTFGLPVLKTTGLDGPTTPATASAPAGSAPTDAAPSPSTPANPAPGAPPANDTH